MSPMFFYPQMDGPSALSDVHLAAFTGTFFIHIPMKMEPIRSSETSAIKTQTPGNYPKRNTLRVVIASLRFFLIAWSCYKDSEPSLSFFLFYFERNSVSSLCSSHSGDLSSNTTHFFLIISFAFL